MTEIVVPTLGESVSEATVAQWLKKEGDAVKADEPLVELETDKVTLEVNAPEDGVIAKITVGEGETVEVGAILGEMGAGTAANDTDEPAAKEEKAEDKPEATEELPEDKEGGEEEFIPALNALAGGAPAKEIEELIDDLAPSVRKMMVENDLDPSNVKGTGKDGRITKEDVQNHLEGKGGDDGKSDAPASAPSTEAQESKETSQQPSQDVAKKAAPTPPEDPKPAKTRKEPGEREERVKMTKLRQTIARRLKEAQSEAAILTTFNEVDMGPIMDIRTEYKAAFEKKHGVKLGFMSFFVKAVIQALKEFPDVNGEIDGDHVVYKNYYDIGIAVSTPQGLVVPVVRDADQKSMAGVEADIMDLGTRARDGKLSLDEMMGGTFTITNGGVFGSLMATPILNRPQSAILGMHKIQQRPMVMPDGSIEARPMMYVALSYDHRIIDGRESVSFLVRVKEALEDPQRLLLDV